MTPNFYFLKEIFNVEQFQKNGQTVKVLLISCLCFYLRNLSVWIRTLHVHIRTSYELKSKELCLQSSCLMKALSSRNNIGLDRI